MISNESKSNFVAFTFIGSTHVPLHRKLLLRIVNKHLKLEIANHWHYLWKDTLSRKEKRNQNSQRRFFRKTNWQPVSWPNFNQIGSRVADLEIKTYPQLALIFISWKLGKWFLAAVFLSLAFCCSPAFFRSSAPNESPARTNLIQVSL